MAKYKITDSQSGKTLVISGDAPPSEQEAEQLFQESGVRNQPQMTSAQAASKILPVPEVQKIDPVTQAAGKAQEFLGNSPLAPILGASIARAAVPVMGLSSGFGGSYGERIKQSAKVGGPMEALKILLPSLEQNPDVRNEIAGTGLKAGLTDVATTTALGAAGKALGAGKELVKGAIGAKSISPWKVASFIKDKEMAAASPMPLEKGAELGNKFVEIAKKAPQAFRDDAIKIAEGYKNDFSNGRSIADTFFSKSGAQSVGISARSGAPIRGGEAWMERKVAEELNNYLKIAAPKAKAADALFSFLYKAPKVTQQAATLMAKLGLAKGMLP